MELDDHEVRDLIRDVASLARSGRDEDLGLRMIDRATERAMQAASEQGTLKARLQMLEEQVRTQTAMSDHFASAVAAYEVMTGISFTGGRPSIDGDAISAYGVTCQRCKRTVNDYDIVNHLKRHLADDNKPPA